MQVAITCFSEELKVRKMLFDKEKLLRLLLSAALIATLVEGRDEGVTEADLLELDCSIMHDPFEIVECASVQQRAKKIGDVEFVSLLSKAKSMLPSTHTFYGGGLIRGDSLSIAFGRMTDFNFDAMYRIPLRMPVYGDWAPELLMPRKISKPMLIYTTTDVGAPELKRDYYYHWHNTGGEYHKAMVRSEEYMDDYILSKNCDAYRTDQLDEGREGFRLHTSKV